MIKRENIIIKNQISILHIKSRFIPSLPYRIYDKIISNYNLEIILLRIIIKKIINTILDIIVDPLS